MRDDTRPPSDILLSEESASEAEVEDWLITVAPKIAEIEAYILFEGLIEGKTQANEGLLHSIGMLEVKVTLGRGVVDVRRCVLLGTEGYGSSLEAEYEFVVDTGIQYLDELSGKIGRRISFESMRF